MTSNKGPQSHFPNLFQDNKSYYPVGFRLSIQMTRNGEKVEDISSIESDFDSDSPCSLEDLLENTSQSFNRIDLNHGSNRYVFELILHLQFSTATSIYWTTVSGIDGLWEFSDSVFRLENICNHKRSISIDESELEYEVNWRDEYVTIHDSTYSLREGTVKAPTTRIFGFPFIGLNSTLEYEIAHTLIEPYLQILYDAEGMYTLRGEFNSDKTVDIILTDPETQSYQGSLRFDLYDSKQVSNLKTILSSFDIDSLDDLEEHEIRFSYKDSGPYELKFALSYDKTHNKSD